ncbi:hypothetical protein ACFP81_00010 [Deinococcus lacus]|uniref:Uncharacterized protein n=1 Tax=Deinococcus lacus TaxID=392561 RepID=A0ABW1YCG8_9DEIO
MNFSELVEREGFPAGVKVTVTPGEGGQVFRAEQGGHSAEILLTPEAEAMYGPGPSLALTLSRLRQMVEAGLSGSAEREVFVGD